MTEDDKVKNFKTYDDIVGYPTMKQRLRSLDSSAKLLGSFGERLKGFHAKDTTDRNYRDAVDAVVRYFNVAIRRNARKEVTLNKKEAILWIKRIQNGEFDRSGMLHILPVGMVAAEKWEDPDFSYGMEYGVIMALMQIFTIKKCDL